MASDGSPLHICKEGTMSITFVGDGHVVHSGALKNWSDPPMKCEVSGPKVLFGLLPSEKFTMELAESDTLLVDGM